MQYILLVFTILHSLLNGSTTLNAQVTISSVWSANTTGIDSSKSVFGLNEIQLSVINSSSEAIKVRYKGSELKFGNNNWVSMPETRYTFTDGGNISLRANDSLSLEFFVPLYDLYYDASFGMESVFISGGIIDYRVMFAITYGSTGSTIYSPVTHIVVPPATVQDAAALNYVIQQKNSCPELVNLFTFYNAFSTDCSYIYNYLSTNFPESALGQIARCKISMAKCRSYRSELDTMPEVKASIMDTRNMLLVSDIPYMKYLAKYLSCQ